MKAKLLFHTPLWLAEYAGRKSHDSNHKMPAVIDDARSAEWISKIGHEALLKHISLHFDLTMPRSILLELEKHIVGVCSPNDLLADINRSTRYTLKSLMKGLKNDDDVDDIIIKNTDGLDLAQIHYIRQYLRGVYDVGMTPDQFKMFLPECWLTSGVWKISLLAFKNIVRQRYYAKTGKPHPLIKELVLMMLNECPAYIKGLVMEERC